MAAPTIKQPNKHFTPTLYEGNGTAIGSGGKTITGLEFKPDLVYSIGYPSYINFNNVELGRYTNPWEINSEPLPWHKIKGTIKKRSTKNCTRPFKVFTTSLDEN